MKMSKVFLTIREGYFSENGFSALGNELSSVLLNYSFRHLSIEYFSQRNDCLTSLMNALPSSITKTLPRIAGELSEIIGNSENEEYLIENIILLKKIWPLVLSSLSENEPNSENILVHLLTIILRLYINKKTNEFVISPKTEELLFTFFADYQHYPEKEVLFLIRTIEFFFGTVDSRRAGEIKETVMKLLEPILGKHINSQIFLTQLGQELETGLAQMNEPIQIFSIQLFRYLINTRNKEMNKHENELFSMYGRAVDCAKIGFNRLIVEIDQIIDSHCSIFSEEEWESILKVFQSFLRNSEIIIYDLQSSKIISSHCFEEVS